jgi:hypothetical protein
VLVWVLGCIAAVLLLFCLGGGIIGAAYFGLFGGGGTVVQTVNLSRMDEVKAGMSQKHCEAILGPGKVVSRERVPAFGGMPAREIKSVVWDDGRGSRAQFIFIDDRCQHSW